MRLLLPAVLGLTILWAWPASAELSVSGEADDLTVEAKDATFSEVVDGIVNQTGMQISIEGTDDPSIDGDFHGSVADVLTEMLRNTSFLISAADDTDQPGLHVVIFGPAVEPVPPPNADNPDLQSPPDVPSDAAPEPPPVPEPAPPNKQNPRRPPNQPDL